MLRWPSRAGEGRIPRRVSRPHTPVRRANSRIWREAFRPASPFIYDAHEDPPWPPPRCLLAEVPALLDRTRSVFDAMGESDHLYVEVHPGVGHTFVNPNVARFLVEGLGAGAW